MTCYDDGWVVFGVRFSFFIFCLKKNGFDFYTSCLHLFSRRESKLAPSFVWILLTYFFPLIFLIPHLACIISGEIFGE